MLRFCLFIHLVNIYWLLNLGTILSARGIIIRKIDMTSGFMELIV